MLMMLIWIIILHIFIYTFLVFLCTIFSKETQRYLNYIVIGVTFTLTQLFDGLYEIKVTEDIHLNGGDIAYSSMLFTVYFLIIAQPEPKNVRDFIYFMLILNIFLGVLFLIINITLNSEWGIIIQDSAMDILQFSFPSLLFSFILLMSEMLLLLYCLRNLLPKLKHQISSTLYISMIFIFVLVLDGIIYPLGIRLIIPSLDITIVNGVTSKLIFGAGFGTLLFIYLNFYPNMISQFIQNQKSFWLYLALPKSRALHEKYEAAKEEIHTLRKLLPICIKCKKIRDDSGYWQEIEHYFRQHSDFKFSHGFCENCLREQYPDLADEVIREMEHDRKNHESKNK